MQPAFFLIGVQKGGTSTLFNLLKLHNQIKVPFRKEIHYFDNNYHKGKKWYLAHFPFQQKGGHFITGEASPYYIFHPLSAQRMKQDFPDAKIIVLLRNPVSRAYSHFQMERKRGDETEDDFLKALEMEKERLDIPEAAFEKPVFRSFNHQHFSYLSRGHYARQLKKWFQYFDPAQLHIVSSEDFFKQPAETLAAVFNFLGLEPQQVEANLIKNKGDYKAMTAEQKAWLQQYFQNHNRELEALLDRRFDWNEKSD